MHRIASFSAAFLFACFALLLIAVPRSAAALGCQQYQWSISSYEAADLVFIGTVVKVSPTGSGEIESQFDVNYFWHGFAPSVVMLTRTGENSLDYRFRRGQRYLVQAHAIGNSGFYNARVCGEVEDITDKNLWFFYFSFLNRQFPVAVIAVVVMLSLATIKAWLTKKYG